jgi:ribosomal 50S subunit-associated protein YjgA (DUF615 family)
MAAFGLINPPRMNREQLYYLRSSILDSMSYIGAYAPEFPEEDATSLEREVAKLMELVSQHRARLKKEEQLRWHSVAEQELTNAFEAYASGDTARGSDQIQRAEEHFRRTFKPKKIRPNFIVAPDGQTFKT